MGSMSVRVGSAAAAALVIVAAFVILRPWIEPTAPTADAPALLSDWLLRVASEQVDGLDRPQGEFALNLPHDHAPHPDTRSESWQLLAHLHDERGEPVGVQLSVLRIGLTSPDAAHTETDWAPRDLYRAHVVILDAGMDRAAGDERMGRGMTDVAGYDPIGRELRLDHWALRFGGNGQQTPWHLRASAEGITADLLLTPEKPPTSGAPDDAPFRGYAFSRLRVEGHLDSAHGRKAVSGVAWLDHLWGDLPIPGAAPVVSDVLQLHLDDGSEVSVVRSRRQDGRGTATVDALRIAADGSVSVHGTDTAEVRLTRHWQGAIAAWPVDWSVRLGTLDLSVTPVVDDQELDFMAPVWSGLVRATGLQGDDPVSGLGTLQLTGYDTP